MDKTNSHFLIGMAAALMVAILIGMALDSGIAIGGEKTVRPECGTFDVDLLIADIKNGVFDDNVEFAKAALSALAWQLKCERAQRKANEASCEVAK